MKRHVISVTILTLAIFLLPAAVFGQADPGLTGAGEATLPGSPLLSGVLLTDLTFGAGVFIPGDGSASGTFQATISGTILGTIHRDITVIAHAVTGNVDSGTATFSGTATVDMDDGLPALTGVPFTLTATSTALVLVINTTSLPAASLTAGDITIQ